MQQRLSLWEHQASVHAPDWASGYRKGYAEGHDSGEHCGEQAVRKRLLCQLRLLEVDLRLGLKHDVHTPFDVLRAVEGIVEGQ
jgi:hypothetical protein